MAPVGLICFRHAGGGSTSFHALRRALTDVGADVTLPIVRDDLRIVQSFQLTDEPPLLCPLYIFDGRDDPLAPPDTLAASQFHPLQPYPARFYHNGHFLCRSPDPALVTCVARVAVAAPFHGSGIH